MCTNTAFVVEKHLLPTNIVKQSVVVTNVLQNTDGYRKEKVYNLTVEDNHEYFANNILVSNCDALRYAAFMTLRKKKELLVCFANM